MKKLVLALAAVGAVVALRPVLKRHMAQKMRDHCKQMAARCEEMMAAQHGGATSPDAMQQKMREHCEEMAGQHERVEPVAA